MSWENQLDELCYILDQALRQTTSAEHLVPNTVVVKLLDKAHSVIDAMLKAGVRPPPLGHDDIMIFSMI